MDQNKPGERGDRIKKLEEIKKLGINPYPSKADKAYSINEILTNFQKLKEENKEIIIAGRLRSVRGHGNLTFAHLEDEAGRIQIALSKKDIGTDSYKNFSNLIDIGDFIEIKGACFLTHKEEKSVMVKSWKILTKSLRPLPDKWRGLQDEEEKLRKRYLDILFNPEVKEMVEKKAIFWNAVREFHVQRGFLEVETPVLENTTGGADAKPFITHHNALDMDVYLRISAGELWQKRLMVAGFEKTFEIGRVFRNEGMSQEHLQDYSQCEAYWAYGNYEDMYKFLRDCYRYVAEKTFGTLKFKIRGFDIDLGKDWPLLDYTEEIKKQTGVDIWQATEKEIEKKLNNLKVEYEADNRERMIDSLWKYARKNIGGPAIIINEPKIISPLAKASSANPKVTERFHILIAGSEIGQGYSELNDPIDQQERFEKQQKLRDLGDEEAQMADYEFIEALEYGMPPTCGHGFSERLFSFLMDKPIRETQIFPLMKPKGEKIIKDGKSKITKIAAVILNKGAKMKPWEEMNAIAHLNAAFGARCGRQLFYQDTISTKDNKKIKLNIQHAIILKEAKSNKEVLDLIKLAKENELEVAEFIREMIKTTDDKKIIASVDKKNLEKVEFLGVLIFGKKSIVDKLADEFDLTK
jgi:lysyl-tRNA synthetase class 2